MVCPWDRVTDWELRTAQCPCAASKEEFRKNDVASETRIQGHQCPSKGMKTWTPQEDDAQGNGEAMPKQRQ